MSYNANVFVGVWRDYSNGMLTLTLPDRAAGILASFLVIFVGFAASNAWNIVKFILHQWRATSDTSDGFHHQSQTALRNTGSHAQTAWTAFTLAIGWRRQLGLATVLKRSWVVLALSITSLALWSTAQLFVSVIWTGAGTQYLVRSGVCGIFFPNASEEQSRLMTSFRLRRAESAATYVSQCYNSGRADAPECGSLPVPFLNWTSKNAACPFDDGRICETTNSSPVRLDSGYIDSNVQLGVNANLEDSITYRQVATCSPLVPKYHTFRPTGFCTQREMHLDYGRRIIGSELLSTTLNYSLSSRNPSDGYRVTSFTFDTNEELTASVWLPSEDIINIARRLNRVVSIFILDGNDVTSRGPVNDPWFRSVYNRTVTLQGQGIRLYTQALDISALACVEEYEICNPARQRLCVQFTPASQPENITTSLRLSDVQQATLSRLLVQMQSPNGLSNIASNTPRPLLASRTVLIGAQQATLPNDQWRAELGRWFAMSLQLTQSGLLEFVTGPQEPSDLAHYHNFTDPGNAAECDRQRIRNAFGFRNFDLAAIIALLVVGAIIILSGLGIDTTIGWLQRRLRRGDHRRIQWLLDGVFQQQRLAFEGAGVRPWIVEDQTIPTTDIKHFPRIDARDPSHLRLYQLATPNTEISVETWRFETKGQDELKE